jgi:lipopolysaccharide export system protein LptA
MKVLVRKPVYWLAALLCGLAWTQAALAEKADSYQDMHVTGEQWTLDNKRKVLTLGDAVQIVRGTLHVKADKGVVTGPDGNRYAVLTASPGKQVFFRQKRDGGPDEWVEGVADRVEYDEKTEIVKFISRANVKSLEGKKVTNEQKGEFLSYDSVNDYFVGANSTSGKHVPGAGVLEMTISPKQEDPKK